MYKNPITQKALISKLIEFAEEELQGVRHYNDFYKTLPATPEFDRMREDLENIMDDEQKHFTTLKAWIQVME